MKEYIDQTGRKVFLSSEPKRIISLVPSQTELLYDLGLGDEVCGITKFCIHPDEWFKTKVRIGGTKKIDFKKIRGLMPDLVIGNKEENNQSQVEELMKQYPVWISDIKNLSDALSMIEQVGELTGKKNNALQLKGKIEIAFADLNNHLKINRKQFTVAYIVWNNPVMTAGADTFIHEMLLRCGFKNIFGDRRRYPEVSKDELSAADPDLILLSSEPYPFREKHLKEFRNLCVNSRVILVDGELFSWYGSRLLKSPDYFRNLIEEISSEN